MYYTISPLNSTYNKGVEQVANEMQKSYHLSVLIEYLLTNITQSITIQRISYDSYTQKAEFITENNHPLVIPTLVQFKDPAILLTKIAVPKIEQLKKMLIIKYGQPSPHDQPTLVVNKNEWLWRARLTLVDRIYEILGVQRTEETPPYGFFIDLPEQWSLPVLTRFMDVTTDITHMLESDTPTNTLTFVEEIPPGYVEVEPYKDVPPPPTLQSVLVIHTDVLLDNIAQEINRIIGDMLTDLIIEVPTKQLFVYTGHERHDLSNYLL